MRKLPPAHLLVREGGVSTSLPLLDFTRAGRPTDFPSRSKPARFWEDFRSAVGRHGGRTCRSASSSRAGSIRRVSPPRWPSWSRRGTSGPSRSASRTEALTRASTHGPSRRHLGTEHHERTFSADSVMELLPEVAGWLDEPFGDASVLPTHLLSRFAREDVTVALGGDGADELAGGLSDFPGRAGLGGLSEASESRAGSGRLGGRDAPGGSRQHQSRLQAQAVPPRGERALGPGAPALARLVLRPGDRPVAGRRSRF